MEAALACAAIRWFPMHQHVYLQQFVAHVLPEAAHAIAPVALRDDDFLAP